MEITKEELKEILTEVLEPIGVSLSIINQNLLRLDSAISDLAGLTDINADLDLDDEDENKANEASSNTESNSVDPDLVNRVTSALSGKSKLSMEDAIVLKGNNIFEDYEYIDPKTCGYHWMKLDDSSRDKINDEYINDLVDTSYKIKDESYKYFTSTDENVKQESIDKLVDSVNSYSNKLKELRKYCENISLNKTGAELEEDYQLIEYITITLVRLEINLIYRDGLYKNELNAIDLMICNGVFVRLDEDSRPLIKGYLNSVNVELSVLNQIATDEFKKNADDMKDVIAELKDIVISFIDGHIEFCSKFFS
jgi:hypothetical protein